MIMTQRDGYGHNPRPTTLGCRGIDPPRDYSKAGSAEPLIHLPFCPCPFSALAGHHDDEDLISLPRRAVNTAHPAMQSHQSVSFNGGY
jgi:hypothetical protein